jgi:hypothetical protein
VKKGSSNLLGRDFMVKFNIKLTNINATPIFYKPRQIPFAFKEQMEEQLCGLEKLGIISQVESSEWGSPLVLILKGDGKIRIYTDYKVMVNKFVQEVKYLLPRIEEIF